MTLTVRTCAVLAGLMIAGCVTAAQPQEFSVSIPLEQQSAKIGEPTTLQVTIALPRGKPATVSTPSGEVIGNVLAYAGSGKRTYTFVLSPEMARRNLRSVVIHAADVQLDGRSLVATLITPPQ